MGELIYGSTDKNRSLIENVTDHGLIPTDHRMSVFASKDKVAFVEGSLVVGSNMKTKKKFYHWRSTSSTGFFRNRAGHLQPYHARRAFNATGWTSVYPDRAFYYLEEDLDRLLGDFHEAVGVYRDACKQYLHLRGAYDLYPMARTMNMPEKFTLLPAALRPYMRTTDWSEFMIGAFGKTRVNNSMIESAKSSEPFILALAREFRGLVSDTEIRKYIENNSFDEQMMNEFRPFSPVVRPFLRLTDTKSRLKLLDDKLTMSNIHLIRFASGMLGHHSRKKDRYKTPLGPIENWTGLTRVV